MDLQLLKTYALSFIGRPYFFGGDDPLSGFDCSGFACELLRATGIMPYSYRTNAQGVYEFIKQAPGVLTYPDLGAFSFYGKNLKEIHHVGFCLDKFTMVEAGGGDASTVSGEIAIQKNAFVRLRPIRFRKDFLITSMPKY